VTAHDIYTRLVAGVLAPQAGTPCESQIHPQLSQRGVVKQKTHVGARDCALQRTQENMLVANNPCFFVTLYASTVLVIRCSPDTLCAITPMTHINLS